MHISEGILSAPALGVGAAVAAAGVGYGLYRMDYDRVPRVAALSAAFFVASLIHVPIGPSSVHLVLNGLVGLVLGWAAFPALVVALFLQAVFFQFGGLTTLGVNVTTMALPAVVCYGVFHRPVTRGSVATATVAGFGAGAASVALACAVWAAFLATAGRAFMVVIAAGLAAHLPVMVVEGVLTAGAVSFLRRVRPELLDAPLLREKGDA